MKISEKINSFNLKKDKFCIAVSGGPDSVFLLLKFKNSNCAAASVNYNFRKESKEEFLYVKKICEEENIKFYGLDVKKKPSGNLQHFARNIRLNFFKKIMKKEKIKYFLTGHHLDDDIETVLMALLKNKSLAAKKGLDYFSRAGGLILIRPLLSFTKKEILNHFKKSKIKYFIDSSNLKNDYYRNFIRLSFLPYLEIKDKKIKTKILRLKKCYNILYEAEKKIHSFIMKKTQKDELGNICFPYNYPPGILTGFIKSGLGINLTRSAEKEFKIFLSGQRKKFNFKNYDFYLNQENIIVSEKLFTKKIKIDLNTKNKLFNVNFKTEIKKLKEKIDTQSERTAYLNYNKIKFPIFLTFDLKGGKIKPYGKRSYIKLKDFFNQKKIPVYKRKKVPVLIDSSEKILWVYGGGIAENFKTGKNIKTLKVSTEVIN